MKVIFLDIDGVLNTPTSIEGLGFNKNCIQNLNKITDKAGASIVISSSWRILYLVRYTIQDLYNLLREEGVTGKFAGYTPLDRDCGYINEEYPDGSRCNRDLEVKVWLERREDVGNFVILDDDAWFTYPLTKNFVWIEEWQKGLQEKDADRAIEILMRE